jgi:hypothetical protein
MKLATSLQLSALGAASLVGLLFLSGCSSMSNAASGTTASKPGTAPMVVTVSDAPLGNILSAKVTISAVSVTPASGSPVNVLSKPEAVELSGLGSLQEPIDLSNLAPGTYNSVTVTVSAAQVTYLDPSTNLPVTATATLSSPTVTVALNPALSFTTTSEVDLHLAFSLSQSFSISGSTVTFTPAISTSAAQVDQENENQREVEVTGTVVAISSSSITVQSGDSGQQFTFAINGSTQFPNGVTPSSITQNAIVQVKGQTQADGTLLALSITPLAAGMSSGQEDGAKGIVVMVTHDSNGNLTGFTMVPQEDFGSMMSTGMTLNVVVAQSTTYGISEDAQQLGLAASMFNSAEIFPGQAVIVTGGTDSSGNLDAAQITLGGENILGVLAATPQASGSNLDFGINLAVPSFLDTYVKLVTLNAVAVPNTSYGNTLTASSFASMTANTAIQVHGYLLVDQSGNYMLTASEISQPEMPEAPEGN